MTTIPKSSLLPTSGGVALLDPADTVILLLDHQSGLFQTVKDIPVADLRRNVEMIAKLATLLKIPVITTASEPNGTNGPLMPEIELYAPHSVYVARKGEVNAWDNQDFVDTVENTGRRTLVMAGVWTSVCVMFPALDARAAGYNVYAAIAGPLCPGRRHPDDHQCCFRNCTGPGRARKPLNLACSTGWWHPIMPPSRRVMPVRSKQPDRPIDAVPAPGKHVTN